VSALLLSAVGGSRRKSGVALSADGLLTVVLGGKSLERGLDDTSSESQNEMESGLLLDVVVRKGSAVLELTKICTGLVGEGGGGWREARKAKQARKLCR
jgi:hypothetical protein